MPGRSARNDAKSAQNRGRWRFWADVDILDADTPPTGRMALDGTAAWTLQQLREAIGLGDDCRHLLHDRARIGLMDCLRNTTAGWQPRGGRAGSRDHGHRRQVLLRALILAVALLEDATCKAAPPTSPEFLGALTGVIPSGVTALTIESRQTDFSNEYDSHKNLRSLFASYDGVSLNNSIFSTLPAGVSLGTTHVSARGERERTRLTLRHGVTDNVTAGILFGWVRATTDVDFSVSGGTRPLGTEGVQRLLGSAPYRYKPVQSETREGALDPQLFLRWVLNRDLADRSWTVLTPTLRLAGSPKDDPDSLVDQPIDYGTNALALTLSRISLLEHNWYSMLSATVTRSFRDKLTARARSQTELIVPYERTERMSRQRGNQYEASAELGWRVLSSWCFARIEYLSTSKDKYSSPGGGDTSGLEMDTNTRTLFGWLGVSWRPEFSIRGRQVPMLFQLQYRRTLDGENVPQQSHIYLILTTPIGG